MVLNVANTVKWMTLVNEKIQENKEYLTELDQAIGDGDHGINMARGFQEVEVKITATDYDNVSDLLKDVSMTLLSKVGGAAGPLYGTAFLKLSMEVKGSETLDFPKFKSGLQEALAGIKQRGKAEKNEKTLVDVWEPLVDYLNSQDSFNAADFESAAKEAMEATKDLEATKGRAAYLRERSIGHLDPGSVSSFYIFSSLAEVLKEGD
ncbi:dihydroxyacetone kinase subunit DhaL [Oceanobacillus alkalisoli]|uniref:dihydroxyacetone kinase subunit DhaL n=1 Tax=Oceanobacillus alkalisoli TaxID=2925113 RepID=UPI001F11A7EA|nr:dihydroxyacetone kinase subunit DhaL [Oceanobacillus alkalisoli]MCF3944256.1 dihydroxyacetone kinase subunit L [Oceanobacillus alkalisoli]